LKIFLPFAPPAHRAVGRRAGERQSGEPIKIGFGMALTGPLAASASKRCSA